MTIQQDFKAYQGSINQELQIAKDRVRNLIGNHHWQTDGEHKEEIIRSVLRNHLPEILRVGKGFICYPPPDFQASSSEGSSSGQIDVLITSKDAPTLYKQHGLVFVTVDAVRAVIEVKTELKFGNGKQSVQYVLNELANEAVQIRKQVGDERNIWVGLFVFNKGEISASYLLERISKVARRNRYRVVNFVCLGPDDFVRFWEDGSVVDSPIKGPIWHSYYLKKLAASYFINNFVFELSPSIPHDQRRAWFPIRKTKEEYRRNYFPLFPEGIDEIMK